MLITWTNIKSSTVEQAKFEYSPLGKTFNKGLGKDDQKEGLFKILKNIEDKNEEQLELFSKANKTNRLAKNESYYNYDNKFALHKFYRDFQNFKNRSLESKYDDISKFYKALNEFEKHKITTDETEKRKKRVVINAAALYNNYFDSYEKTYDESDLNEKEGRNSNQFKIADDVLPEWLESKNDFNEAKKLIDNIRIDMGEDQVSKKDKKVFNDLNRLIIDISNNKIKKKRCC